MKTLEETIISLIRIQPFYAHLLSALNVEEDDHVAIAGYTIRGGKIVLYINSFVFGQLTLENRRRVMIHELLHIIARHSTRQRNRAPYLWNIACDIAVNQMIEGIPIKQKVKTKRASPAALSESWEEREVGGLTRDNIVLADGTRLTLPIDRTAEEYYNMLKEKMPPGENANHLLTAGRLWGDNYDKLHPTWADAREMPEELADALLKNKVMEAVKKAQGNIPSSVRRYIEQLGKTTTPWRRILKLFVARQACRLRYMTFKKQNKRLIEEGMPGFKYDKRLKLVAAVDTSGSISEKELSLFYAELLNIQKCGANITVIECDCQIQKAYQLGKYLKPEFRGRGGTDFRPVWQYITAHRIRPDAIIYLTDGKGQAPEKSLYPTLWALTPAGEKPWMMTGQGKKPVEWGLVINMEIS